MPKYLILGTYTNDGARALMKRGGSARKTAVENALKAAGGTLESLYFAFGETDVYAIADIPDNVTMAGISMATANAGFATLKTVVLLTPQEMDGAAKKAQAYSPPGK